VTHAFDPRRGLIVIRAELTGPTGSAILQLALDTGATTTLINVAMLVAIGYDPALATDRVQVTTGSGVEFASRIELQRLTSLGQERYGLPVLATHSTAEQRSRWVAGAGFSPGITINCRLSRRSTAS
jgi:hypothetical protein